jgi:hypothetical protein
MPDVDLFRFILLAGMHRLAMTAGRRCDRHAMAGELSRWPRTIGLPEAQGAVGRDALLWRVSSPARLEAPLRKRRRRLTNVVPPPTIDTLKRPPKAADRVYPVVKNQEYDRVYDGKIEQVEVITPVQRRWRAAAA